MCFFQAAVVLILLYGRTTWMLTKWLEKLDDNYTRMLRAILNKSWWQHPTRHQLYGHLPPITKTIQVRRTRHAGHCWRSRDELISDVLLWNPAYGRAKAIRPARTYIQQLCEDKGCSERGSGISVLAARHNNDDDDKSGSILFLLVTYNPVQSVITKQTFWINAIIFIFIVIIQPKYPLWIHWRHWWYYCCRKWTYLPGFKSWTRQFAFHIVLIHLIKVQIQLSPSSYG